MKKTKKNGRGRDPEWDGQQHTHLENIEEKEKEWKKVGGTKL